MNGWPSPEIPSFGHSLGYLLPFNLKLPLAKPSHRCEVTTPKAYETIYTFIIPKKKWHETLHNETEASHPFYCLHKVQDDHPKADQGGKLTRTMSSLTGHQVSILPNSNSKEASLFTLLHVEKHSVTVKDFTFWPINSPKDIYKNNKTYLTPLSRDRYNPVPVSR